MNKTVLQVPIDANLRRVAEKTALDEGFSSLQEAIRVFLKKFADRRITVSFEDIILSEKASSLYSKIDEDLKKGKNIYKAKNVNDLLKKLRENSLS